MKTKKPVRFYVKLGVYLALMAAFVVYLVFAGPLVSYLYTGGEGLRRVPQGMEAYTLTTDKAHGWVGTVNYLGGPGSKALIEGIAFCEADTAPADTDAKEVRLVLQSARGEVYDVKAGTITKRVTLAQLEKEYSIQNAEISAIATFSTLPLPAGEYTVYYYVQEQEQLKGLADTGTTLVVRPGALYDAAGGENSAEDAEPSDALD